MRNKIITCILLILFIFGCDRTFNSVDIKPQPTKFYKSFNIEDKTYSRNITIFVTEDTVPVINYLESYDSVYNKGDFTGVSGLTYSLNNGETIVWISKNKPEIFTHELFHCTSFILRSSGVNLSDETEEVYAYELDYLIREYYKNINDENINKD